MQNKKRRSRDEQGVCSHAAASLHSASARDLKLTRGSLPLPPESSETNTNTQRNQMRGKEIGSTYLPLHRPLHAASVQSKSRTEIISGRTGTPGPVLSTEHSWGSTFTRLGGVVFYKESLLKCQVASATIFSDCLQQKWTTGRPYFPNTDFRISLQ